MLFTEILCEERIVFLHCLLAVALRVTIEIVRTLAGRVLNLSEGEGHPTRTTHHFVIDFVHFPATNPMSPSISH